MVGQVISLTPCEGGVARIMTRSMYVAVNQKLSWNSDVELTKEACAELAFLSENVDSLNFHCPWAPLQPPVKFVCLFVCFFFFLTRPITPVALSLTMSTNRRTGHDSVGVRRAQQSSVCLCEFYRYFGRFLWLNLKKGRIEYAATQV